MSETSFPHLTPVAFLQAFVTQGLLVKEKSDFSPCASLSAYIEQLGLEASACFEAAYRCETELDQPLDPDTYAQMIIGIKNKIGGNFSRGSSPPGVIRVVNTRCPFGESVQDAPELCRMTSSVFGGIAARSFGYAKVALNKRIAVGDGTCDICVYTDPSHGVEEPGDEYRRVQDRIVGSSASAPLVMQIDERMRKTWCNSRPHSLSYDTECPQLVAESPEMTNALEAVVVAAPTRATVLITGETGVGKEVIARAIHAMSPRWHKKFIAVNCSAIPDGLIESHLFGHERGAFTNAFEVHHGYFERAEGGTLFLDEIDSLTLSAQVRLLRVLEQGEFERVGAQQSLHVDVRIIAAGSHRLETLVKQGGFRSDLYYRINVVPIPIPPLRERRSDIQPLITHILRDLAAQHRQEPKTLGREALLQAMVYDWPGNVRELKNTLERAFLFARGSVITDLRVLLSGNDRVGIPNNTEPSLTPNLRAAKKQAADKVEVDMLRATLLACQGNVRAAAKALGMTSRALHQKLQFHQIDSHYFRATGKSRAPLRD